MRRRQILLSAVAVLALVLVSRRVDADDFEVTKERRAAIIKAAPEAKKFVLADDIIKKVIAKKPANPKALKAAFDKLAKGKWLLFTSPLSSVGSEGFMINFWWGDGDPYMSTLLVQVKNPKGWDSGQRSLGPRYAMLVKYKGGEVADPGYDLMALGAWK